MAYLIGNDLIANLADFWVQDRSKPAGDSLGAPYLSRPGYLGANNQTCTQNDQHAGCTFEDDKFLRRAKTIVSDHAALKNDSRPLFLYW